MSYKMRLMATFSIGTTAGIKMGKNGVIAPNMASLPGAVMVEVSSFAEATCLGVDELINMSLSQVNKSGTGSIPVSDLVVKLYNAIEKLIPDKYFCVTIGPYRVEKDLTDQKKEKESE